MNRRDFLKKTAAGTAALGGAAIGAEVLRAAGMPGQAGKNGVSAIGQDRHGGGTGHDGKGAGHGGGAGLNGAEGTVAADGAGNGRTGMAVRINPGCGDRVSLLGFGCMRWPMKKDAHGKDRIDQETVNALVDQAIECGVNYFDTSPVYLQGQSEEAAGIALGRHPRSSYYLATKLSNFSDNSRPAALKMYRNSFKALQTDYFDYYLLHSIGRGGYQAFKERYEDNGMLDFLLNERKAGRIRNLGFSFHGSKDEFDALIALHDKYRWDFVQIEMNYLDWRHAKAPWNTDAEYLYAELEKRGIPVVIMEPLLGGRLAKLPDAATEKLLQRAPASSVASWAFRFVGSYPGVLCILSGMTNAEVLKDNLKTFCNFQPLTEEETGFLLDLADLLDSFPTVPCTGCQYCMPCPYGIDIPGIFRHYNEMVRSGSVASSSDQEDYRRLRRKYLVSYDRAVETIRQADHCIHCGQCTRHCPQSIRIPRELSRIADYVEKLRAGTL